MLLSRNIPVHLYKKNRVPFLRIQKKQEMALQALNFIGEIGFHQLWYVHSLNSGASDPRTLRVFLINFGLSGGSDTRFSIHINEHSGAEWSKI